MAEAEEDVIDLSPYLRVLLRRWWLILGLAVVVAGAVGAANLASPVVHEASAMVALAWPRESPMPGVKVYLEMATSGSMVADLARSLPSGQGGNAPDAADLRGRLKANPGPDPNLVRLQVRDGDPRRAVEIARVWSAVFVQAAAGRAREARQASSAPLEEQMEEQAKLAAELVRQAESELAEARSATGLEMLQEKLGLERSELSARRSTRYQLQAIARDAAAIGNRLKQMDPSARGSDDDLAILLLRTELREASVQFPGNPEGAGRTVGAELARLDGVAALIEERLRENDRQIAATESAMPDLLARIQRARQEMSILELKAEGARKVLLDLEVRLREAMMNNRPGAPQVRTVGEPSVEAVPRGTTRNTAVAGVLGLMVGVAAAFGLEYVSRRRAAPQAHPQGSL